MKSIKTEAAVGHVLCHDLTQIIKGITKEAIFRKGHVVTEVDIPVLLSMGKENLYVWENSENMLHENEAAKVLCKISMGKQMHRSEVKEGKIELIADCDGVLKINKDGLDAVNGLGEMMIASIHGNFPVKKGNRIAGTRIIPLLIEKEKMERAKTAAGKEPLFEIMPYRETQIGIVTTGSEISKGRIEDTFTPVLIDKLKEFPVQVIKHIICSDQHQEITAAIKTCIKRGAQMVLCTGGMSVDPDDRTPLGIKNAGVSIVTYGAPVLPGAMFLLGYYDKTLPVLGLPGCVMYARRTIFDLVLPRLMTGERLSKKDFSMLGQGGLCLSCSVCTFPNCGFGKGGY